MKEQEFDDWLREYEKRRPRTKIPPKTIRRIMEERPKPGRGGLGPKEKEGELWQ